MKHWNYYIAPRHSVAALRWTEDATASDLNDFCDGYAVLGNDPTKGALVYNQAARQWMSVQQGDWIIDEPSGLIPMSHERFMQLYEQESDGPQPRGND